jgi:inner membrane protein
MDTITHLALGACIGAACAPPHLRRRGALLGALLNSLPDLDVLALAPLADPVLRLSYHRSATHSILVLPVVALAIWWLLLRYWTPVREAPRRWLLLCLIALVSHPLLDAFTVYGTQLFWPLDRPPVMISSIFIIDPLFTLPLLIGAGVVLFSRDVRRAAWWSRMGLAASAVYLAWTVTAKWNLEQGVRADLALRGMTDAKVLTVPAPLQSVLWRVLVVTSAGSYYEGYYSYWANQPLKLDLYPSSRALLAPVQDRPDVKRLQWFTRDFYSVSMDQDRVVMTDLRMGGEPVYVFRYVVGESRPEGTVPVEPAQILPWPRFGRDQWVLVWRRIFNPQTTAL